LSDVVTKEEFFDAIASTEKQLAARIDCIDGRTICRSAAKGQQSAFGRLAMESPTHTKLGHYQGRVVRDSERRMSFKNLEYADASCDAELRVFL
jgi:hypothetical protein